MQNPEHRPQTVDIETHATKSTLQTQAIRTGHSALMPRSKQDLLRAVVMCEVLGKPKCRQSSIKKQF